MKTEDFNLSDNILKRLEKNKIVQATPIQKQIIPAIIEGRDVLAQSETGSGKTLSFAIPIIEDVKKNKSLQALILVPTRELCKQIADEFFKFSERGFFTEPVYGGVSIQNQLKNIKKSNVVVATPGRLLDILQRKGINFKDLKYLVLDEADRMLDMGFITDIEKIMKSIPQKKQTLLFSATISKEISGLSKKYLDNPVNVHMESTVKADFLNQTYYRVSQKEKMLMLIHLLRKENDLVMVFCNRKDTTEHLANELEKAGLKAKALNGDMSQDKRERITKQFKQKRFNILIATDVASRGLHIEDVSHVYNYEIPRETDSYTHRIGRTARAGKKGNAISFVSTKEDEKFFRQILFNHKGKIELKSSEQLGFRTLDNQFSGERNKKKSGGTSRPFQRNNFRGKESSRQRVTGDRKEPIRDKESKDRQDDTKNNYSGNKDYKKKDNRFGKKQNSRYGKYNEKREVSGDKHSSTQKDGVRKYSDRKKEGKFGDSKKFERKQDSYKKHNRDDNRKQRSTHIHKSEKETSEMKEKSFWKKFLLERDMPFIKRKKRDR